MAYSTALEGSPSVDDLGHVNTVDRLSQNVVIAVANSRKLARSRAQHGARCTLTSVLAAVVVVEDQAGLVADQGISRGDAS